MEILAMYDIANPKRLREIERTMKRFGVRVQKSVFECSLNDSAIQQMINDVRNIMLLEEDSFRVYPLLAQSRTKQTIIGQGELAVFAQRYIV